MGFCTCYRDKRALPSGCLPPQLLQLPRAPDALRCSQRCCRRFQLPAAARAAELLGTMQPPAGAAAAGRAVLTTLRCSRGCAAAAVSSAGSAAGPAMDAAMQPRLGMLAAVIARAAAVAAAAPTTATASSCAVFRLQFLCDVLGFDFCCCVCCQLASFGCCCGLAVTPAPAACNGCLRFVGPRCVASRLGRRREHLRLLLRRVRGSSHDRVELQAWPRLAMRIGTSELQTASAAME